MIRFVTGEGTSEVLLVLRCELWVPCLEYYDAVTPSVTFTTDYAETRTPRTVSRDSLSTAEATDLCDLVGWETDLRDLEPLGVDGGSMLILKVVGEVTDIGRGTLAGAATEECCHKLIQC